VEEKNISGRPEKLSATDEQCLKVMYLRKRKKKSSNDLTQDLRDASGPSVDPSTVHQSLIRNGSPWKSGCQEANLKARKRGERAEVGQMIQEVD